MITSRPRKKIEYHVKPDVKVISKTQIRFFFKTTDAINDEDANPNDGFCS